MYPHLFLYPNSWFNELNISRSVLLSWCPRQRLASHAFVLYLFLFDSYLLKTHWLWIWFWRVTLVVSLSYAWYCFYVPSNSIVWADNYTSAQHQAAQSGKPIILFFTGKWCVPCKVMKRNVWADDQVMNTVNTAFIPVTIDVDDPDNAAVLIRYNVGGTPITIVTDPNGNALQWRVGGIGKSEFLELLRASNPSAINDL